MINITYDKLYQEFTKALHLSPHLTEELKNQLKKPPKSFKLYNKKVDNFSYAAKCFFDDALKTYLFFRWKETPYVLDDVNYNDVTEEYQNNVTTTISSDQCISEIISAFFEKCVKCETEKTPLNTYFELEIPPLNEIFTSNYLEGCHSNSIQPQDAFEQTSNKKLNITIFKTVIDRLCIFLCKIRNEFNKSIKGSLPYKSYCKKIDD